VEVMSDKIIGRMPHRLRVDPGSTITIGREEKNCEFCIKDKHVSRRHAKLHFLAAPDKQLYLEPISSTNPTLRNDVRLPVNIRHNLNNGDVFKIADHAFRVDLPQSSRSDSIATTRGMDNMANDTANTLQAAVATAGSTNTAGTGIFMEAGGVVVAETLVLSYDDEEENDRCWWFRTVDGCTNACLRLFQLVYCRIAGRVKR